VRHKFKIQTDLRKFYVTSDNHFGHNFMAKHRGFKSVEEHDEFMISQWNNIVEQDAVVVAFGDWSFLNVENTQAIMDRLNGYKYVIPGNHDDSNRLAKWFPGAVLPELTNMRLVDENTGDRINFVASHYPLASWDGSDKGTLQLHGHLHSINNETEHHFCAPFLGAGSRFDIGIDNAAWFGYRYSPIPINTVWKKHQNRVPRDFRDKR
jgi:calcineurin-like phosphoesterase family protein